MFGKLAVCLSIWAMSFAAEPESAWIGEAEARHRLDLAFHYLNSGRTARAERLNLPAILNALADPSDRARARGAMAALAAARRDYAAAESLNHEVLSYWRGQPRTPESNIEAATVLNNLGGIAFWKGRPTAAAQWMEQSLALWRSPAGLVNLAVVYSAQKRYAVALNLLEEATRLDPLNLAALELQARCLRKTGRKSAGRQLKRAIQHARDAAPPATAHLTVDIDELRPNNH